MNDDEKNDRFDPDKAEKACDDAMSRVDAAADEAWKASADAAVQYVAASKKEFTADDVWKLLDAQGLPRPREPRALGPRMRAAISRNIASSTDKMVKSSQISNHRRKIPVWLSKIFAN